jgi:hypothetical protein
MGKRIAGFDLFDKPSTLSKRLPKLIKAFAIDAMELHETDCAVDRDAVAAWLRSSLDATTTRYDSPGVGHDIRIESKGATGASLVPDFFAGNTLACLRI